MEIRSTRSFNAILATIIDDSTKDGGQEFLVIIPCVTLNFDRFDWLISSMPQKDLGKKFLDAIFSTIFCKGVFLTSVY